MRRLGEAMTLLKQQLSCRVASHTVERARGVRSDGYRLPVIWQSMPRAGGSDAQALHYVAVSQM